MSGRHRNGCPDDAEITVRMIPKWLSGSDRNQCPDDPEIRSQVTPFVSWERRRDRKGYDVSTSESIRVMAQDSDTYSAGVRYNFHPNAAIKLSVSNINSPNTDLDSTLVSAGIAIKF